VYRADGSRGVDEVTHSAFPVQSPDVQGSKIDIFLIEMYTASYIDETIPCVDRHVTRNLSSRKSYYVVSIRWQAHENKSIVNGN